MIDDLSDRILVNARGQVDALRRLTSLRRANQQLQDCFHALEGLLPPDANRLDLVFSDDPKPDGSGLALAWNGGGLAQILPVSSGGISAFQLRFRNILRGENAVLHIHLTAVEEQRVVDRWTVPLQRVEEGWTTFSLNRAIVGAPRTLELRLNLEGGEDSGVAVCHGAQQLPPAFQLRDGATGATVRPHGPAIRVWCGAQHAAHAMGPNYVAADDRRLAAPTVVQAPLAPTLLARASHANAGNAKFDFPPVKNVPNQIAMECHPPSVGFTLAHVPLPPLARPLSVSADTMIRNAKSKAVEFAIVLVPDADRAKDLLRGAAKALPHEGFSGWAAISADERGSLSAIISRPEKDRPKLFFATRMKIPGENFFAWARFRGVLMGLQSP